MTLGEKIRKARNHSGLSQEQLAEKMCVSRSAVAKWEAGNGLPDIENLKLLSRILGVSLDQLLQEDSALSIREPVNLALWGRGCNKVKKDRIIRSKFPDALIHSLLAQISPTREDQIIANVPSFLTDAPLGIPAYMGGGKNTDREFYLVEQENCQYFVMVTDTFLECGILEQKITESRFSMGNWNFIKCNYPIDGTDGI